MRALLTIRLSISSFSGWLLLSGSAGVLSVGALLPLVLAALAAVVAALPG
jgi:hypothetical protein